MNSAAIPLVNTTAADVEAQYASACDRLRRHGTVCVALSLVLFFGRSLVAWAADKPWVITPDMAAVYILSLPGTFALLSARDLPAWLRLWRERRYVQIRRGERQLRPVWQYMTAGAGLGAVALLLFQGLVGAL